MDAEEENNRAQALAVKNQLVIFDMLINCRIKLQKALINSNKLPQHDIFSKFSEASEDVLADSKNRALEEEKKLLKAFRNLQQLLETQESPVENEDVVELVADHKKLLSKVNVIMSEWWQKTNYGKSDSKALEKEPETMRAMCLKKTRMKRSTYKIIGKDDIGELMTDNEIFDDDDFYSQLLRQLIASKTAIDSIDPMLSIRWLEIQKIRKKMKRKIETRASKGRMINYKIHQPLVSFMAPIENNYVDSAKDALFASLFAKWRAQKT